MALNIALMKLKILKHLHVKFYFTINISRKSTLLMTNFWNIIHLGSINFGVQREYINLSTSFRQLLLYLSYEMCSENQAEPARIFFYYFRKYVAITAANKKTENKNNLHQKCKSHDVFLYLPSK